jgi:hypothetical protein
MYKEQLFDHLTEWVYPSQPKEQVFEKIEELFIALKDCNSDMLKKLLRNSQMLFPVRFEDLDPFKIRRKLYKLANEGEARETIASLQLRLKSHFLDEPLESVVVLAADIFKEVVEKMESWDIVEQFFRFKSHIFTAPFNQLNAHRLLDNLQAYKIRKNDERREIIN